MVFFYRLLALGRFLIANLRAEDTSDDGAERERNCKPEAKAHHCSGA